MRNIWTLFEHPDRDEVLKAPFYQYLWLLKTVRFRSAALIKALDFQGFFYVVEDDIDKKYSFGYNKKENTERVIGEMIMCTAATYNTKDFYFGRTLDYESVWNFFCK